MAVSIGTIWHGVWRLGAAFLELTALRAASQRREAGRHRGFGRRGARRAGGGDDWRERTHGQHPDNFVAGIGDGGGQQSLPGFVRCELGGHLRCFILAAAKVEVSAAGRRLAIRISGSAPCQEPEDAKPGWRISGLVAGMQRCCHSASVQAKATINERGVITIPAAMRQALGLKPNDEVLIEETEQGLLIRPMLSVPFEIYTEKRIAEFASDDEEIGKLLPKKRS